MLTSSRCRFSSISNTSFLDSNHSIQCTHVPEPFTIAGIRLHLFGIIAATSLVLGYLLYAREFRRHMITPSAPDVAFAVLLPAFVCARLAFIITNWQIYSASPVRMFSLGRGSCPVWGIIGGLIGGFIYAIWTNASFAKGCDSVALGIALAFPLSRLGCFAAGCCYGIPTEMPWGVIYRNSFSLARPLGLHSHPVQLYELLIGLGILHPCISP